MRKLFILFLLVGTAGVAYAQPANVVNAYNYMKSNDLDKAKEAIDKAVVHPKTSVKSKTWRYRGDIYYKLFSSTDPKFQALEENPAGVAYESYKKAKELDSKGSYNKEMDQNLRVMQNIALNNGVADFNDKNYEKAYAKFVTSADIAEHLGRIDSLAVFNCALASERGGKTDRAIGWYKKCMEINYRPADCCGFIIFMLQQEKRDDEALAQVRECRAQFPDDQNMIITELNYYLKEGKFDDAAKNLRAAITNDPNNEVLHFSLGTVLDNQGKKEEAKTSYLKALELKEDYFDANYNLGALYFNEAVEVNNKANDELDNKKAAAIQEQANEIFKQAMPYLERAREIKPTDKNTLNSLKALYARTGDSAKYEEVNELLKN